MLPGEEGAVGHCIAFEADSGRHGVRHALTLFLKEGFPNVSALFVAIIEPSSHEFLHCLMLAQLFHQNCELLLASVA